MLKTSAELGVKQPCLVHSMIELPGVPGVGFGTGPNADQALLRAYSEWIERRTFHSIASSQGLHSTNGMSAHPAKVSAIENAKLELIERDAFLVGWLAGRSPRWLEEREVQALDPTGSLLTHIALFAANHFRLKLGIIGVSQSAVVVVTAIIACKPLAIAGGVAIQTKAAYSLKSALRGAVQTQRTAATVVWNRQRGDLPPLKIDSSDLSQPRDLLAYYFDRANAIDLDWYIGGSAEALELPACAIDVETLSPSSAWPLTVAMASRPLMQDYFACKDSSDHINWERLRAVFPGAAEVNERMHPLS